jgi:hypothetical protein
MLDAYWAVWKAYPGAAALHAGALLAGRWRDDPRAEAWWPRFNALVDSLTPADPARVPSLWARAQVGYHRSLQAGLTDDAAGGLRAQALRDAEATFTGGGATAAGLEAASWLIGGY